MPIQEIIPAKYQPGLPMKKLILEEAPGEESVPMDVVFVGGGPAGLSGAIELARLARKDAESGVALGQLSQGRARQERGQEGCRDSRERVPPA